MTKMTKKEMYAFIATELADNTDVVAFCENEIALLERKAEKAKATAAAKRVAGDELRDRVQAVLTTDFATIADITAALDDPEVTASKVTYRLNSLCELGVATKADAKIEGAEGGKTRTVKVFALAE